ncbi:MAG: hypothetical protein JSR77_18555 [Planctomycetes bacterium]|nr:hypothetical protein [Planctomycetota bacterium]
MLVTAPTVINAADTTIAGVPLSTAQITVRGTTLTINGAHTVASLLVDRAGVVTHSPGTAAMSLTVSGDCTIVGNANAALAGRIDVKGKGHAAATGPGAGINSFMAASGAGHAGRGGTAGPSSVQGGDEYGDVVAPLEVGSGGGSVGARLGGAGGGCVRIVVGGTLRIDGQIVASGLDGAAGAWTGGGSGGSIWLGAARIEGTGTVAAAGGASPGAGGGGSGGRVSLSTAQDAFAGSLIACGGAGNSPGGAGTVVRTTVDGRVDLELSNCGRLNDEPTVIAALPLRDIAVRGAANVMVADAVMRAANLSDGGVLTLGQGAMLTGRITATGQCGLVGDGPQTTGPVVMLADGLGNGPTLDIRGNWDVESLATHAGGIVSNRFGSPERLSISSRGDIRIDESATLNYDSHGHSGSDGDGAGAAGERFGAGAGHGGRGGDSLSATGGEVYGVAERPELPGSGGGSGGAGDSLGGPGGGVVMLEAAGTIRIDGEVSARGGSGWSADGAQSAGGGGSGGSIVIRAPRVEGTGLVDAGGGAGAAMYATTNEPGAGGGGGGRIGVFTCGPTSLRLTAAPGAGVGDGLDGTIFHGSGSLTIDEDPVGGDYRSGFNVELHAAAHGDGPVAYQWRWNGGPISEGFDGAFFGVDSPMLEIADVKCEHRGVYDCLVTDRCGAFATAGAQITVTPSGDVNNDGTVDGQDVESFFRTWEAGGDIDINGDGGVDGADAQFFFDHWGRGC